MLPNESPSLRSGEESPSLRSGEEGAPFAPPPAHSRRVGLRGLAVISIVAILIVAVVVAVAVVRPLAGSSPSPSPVVYAGINTSGYTLGAADAPVTIDIYMDFQCPICHDWYLTVFPALETGALKSGEAKLVFHGTSAIGPESVSADKAAYAAAQQGRFWNMWAALYAHQGASENSGAFTDANLRTIAQGLGLDLTRYDADFASSAAADFVSASEADSHTQGITGTPTLVIAGVQYQGVSAYSDLQAAIDAAKSGATPSR
jgi:protein-disulfide isomerase